jgi:FkbM family methyltransferase
MVNNQILNYLRHCPVDIGKSKIAELVDLSHFRSPLKYKAGGKITLELDLEEYLQKQVFLFNYYERNTIRHMRKILAALDKNKKITCFDVGANIGYYSLMMTTSLNGKQHQIHSFEPNPYTFNFLINNIEFNNFKSIVPVKLGLSNQTQELEIYYNKKNLGTANTFQNKGALSANISLVRCDDYCHQNSIENIDLIKVDIEGGELNFIRGASGIIKDSKNLTLIIEIVEQNCKNAGYRAVELFDLIISLGFKAYLPRPWPFGLVETKFIENYHDNYIFCKSK